MRFFVTILLIIGASTLYSGTAPPGKIAVSVESTRIDFHPATANLYQANDTIDLTIETGDLEISGVNLKIAVTPGPLSVTEILPGPFIDSCGWEYFQVRPAQLEAGDTLELWQITAVSELIPDSIRPTCYSTGGEAPIARLVIQGHSRDDPAGTQQILFYWESCADNSISDKSGNKLFVSSEVSSAYEEPKREESLTNEIDPFPTLNGTPASCINEQNPNRPLRRINFYIGNLEYQVNVEETAPADSAGE